MIFYDTAKPVVRQGRKAAGLLPETAGSFKLGMVPWFEYLIVLVLHMRRF